MRLYVGEVGNPQPVRCRRPELALHEICWACQTVIGAGGDRECLAPPGSRQALDAPVLREMPTAVCDELVISRSEALSGTQALRFGLGELLTGSLAGMFDGPTTITTTDSPGGFVVDVSGCGTDDRVLRFAMLAGQRAVSQMLAGSKRRTLRINDEGWRVASTLEGVRYMQHDFKLGRVDAMCNILVVHRFAEIGGQADGVTGEIASRLVGDADLHVMFHQGDEYDVEDCVDRLKLPISTREALLALPPHRCLIHLRGRLALLQVELSRRMRTLADTNDAVRGDLTSSRSVQPDAA